MAPHRAILTLALSMSIVAAACSTDDGGEPEGSSGWEDPAGNMVAFSNVAEPAGIDLVRTPPPTPAPVEGAEGTPSEPQGMPDLMDPAANAKATQPMRGGAAVLDFDRDGWQDLFLVSADAGPDRLYRNNGDGTFSEVGSQAGVAWEHLGSGAAAADFDGDGWTDLHVTSHGMGGSAAPGHHRLYRNRGDGTFEEIAGRAGVATTSRTMGDGFGSAFGDVDLDGDLDLLVTGWQDGSLGNRLFMNNGDATFTDVTEAAGITDDGIRGFAPCLADMTGDRYPEVLIAADFGTSRYFVNNGDGTFSEQTAESGVDQTWAGMGNTVADFDGDGRLDWYVTAIFDEAGLGYGDGNKLYMNRGSGVFEESAKSAGVDDGGWGWGTAGVDLNHDGMVDIIETNGWHRPEYQGERAKLWINLGDGTFTDVATPARLDYDIQGLGLLHFDYDEDGDQDVALTSPAGDFRLYRNELTGPAANWLRVFLDTTGADGIAPHGLGSRVTVSAGNLRIHQWIVSCAHYLTSSELSAHFGLGDAEKVDELRVEWPDGSVTIMTDLKANQTMTVSPG